MTQPTGGQMATGLPPGFKVSVDKPEDNRSPLVHVVGKVLKHEWNQRQYKERDGRPASTALIAKFYLGELNVIESRVPYSLPIGDFEIPYSDKSGTHWAAFTTTFRAAVPVELYKDLDDPLSVLDGKVCEFHFKPGVPRRMQRDGVWGEVTDEPSWNLVSVQGVNSPADGGENLIDQVVEFAVGKNQDQVHAELYTRMSWKGLPGYTAALEGIAERTFIPGLIASGQLMQHADGTFAKGPNAK